MDQRKTLGFQVTIDFVGKMLPASPSGCVNRMRVPQLFEMLTTSMQHMNQQHMSPACKKSGNKYATHNTTEYVSSGRSRSPT